jgi:hypothetical protein
MKTRDRYIERRSQNQDPDPGKEIQGQFYACGFTRSGGEQDSLLHTYTRDTGEVLPVMGTCTLAFLSTTID